MARQKKCPECPPEGAPAWMATFSDMMCLLVTFFVLLMSYSQIAQTKFTLAMTSLRGALGVMTASSGSILAVTNMPMFQIGKGQVDQVIQDSVKKLQDVILESELLDNMSISQTKDQLMFNISDAVLFESGHAELKVQADTILTLIGTILTILPLEVRIEGHTDNIPINTSRYPSNWELSYARTLSIAEKFAALGVNYSRFQLIGYGEHRPLADNSTSQGRALNRRVEIIVNLKDEIRRSLLPGDENVR